MPQRKTGLGKGLDTLLPQDFDPGLLLDKQDRIQKIQLNKLEPNPDQPRRNFDQGALEGLAESIKVHGVLLPLIVVPVEGGKYQIIAGERRWRAAQIAGLANVPTIVRERKEIEKLEISLIENMQRVDLSPIEQAISIERLHQQFNVKYSEISKRIGKAESTLANIVRLLGLPKSAREALQNQEITEGHARAILAIKKWPEQQEELLRRVIKEKWTVRQAEQFAVKVKGGTTKQGATKQAVAKTTPQTERLSKALGAPVSFSRLAKGGKLEIRFKDDDELKRITSRLVKGLKN